MKIVLHEDKKFENIDYSEKKFSNREFLFHDQLSTNECRPSKGTKFKWHILKETARKYLTLCATRQVFAGSV